MAYRTWQIEHRGEFRLALRRATSLPRGNRRDYVSYKKLVRWRFACALRNHAPPSYNYNMFQAECFSFFLRAAKFPLINKSASIKCDAMYRLG